MSVRAPQYGRRQPKAAAPEGPNPAAAKGLRVEPFGAGFAVVEGLGVISLHRAETEAQTALERRLERRKLLRERAEPRPAPLAQADNAEEAEADRQHRPG